MLVLLGIGFAAGVITAVSPCILPVLPIVLAGGASSESRRRPLAIVAGLVASFTAFTLAAASLLSALGLPQDLLRNVAIGLLFVLAATLVFPRLATLLERPFAFLTRRRGGDGARRPAPCWSRHRPADPCLCGRRGDPDAAGRARWSASLAASARRRSGVSPRDGGRSGGGGRCDRVQL